MQQVKVIKSGKTSNQSAFLSVNPTDESEGIKEIYRVFARAQAMINIVIATADLHEHVNEDDDVTYVVASLIAADDLITDTIRRVTEAKKMAEIDGLVETRAYNVAGILRVAGKAMWGASDGSKTTEHLVYGYQVLEAAEELLSNHAGYPCRLWGSVGTSLRSAA